MSAKQQWKAICRELRERDRKPVGRLRRIRKLDAPYLGRGFTFWKDEAQRLFLKIKPEARERPHGRFAPSCYRYCTFVNARPHLTCLHCKVRRFRAGEIPQELRVELFAFTIWMDRPHCRVKAWILKRLMSLAEFFANY